jgi:hypothetical protein
MPPLFTYKGCRQTTPAGTTGIAPSHASAVQPFVAVVEETGVAGTAERENISPSAIRGASAHRRGAAPGTAAGIASRAARSRPPRRSRARRRRRRRFR